MLVWPSFYRGMRTPYRLCGGGLLLLDVLFCFLDFFAPITADSFVRMYIDYARRVGVYSTRTLLLRILLLMMLHTTCKYVPINRGPLKI